MADDHLCAQCLHLQRKAVRCPLRPFPPCSGRSGDVWAALWPVAPVPTKHRASGLGSRQRRLGAGADQLPLLLRHGGVDAHHQDIGSRRVR